MLELIKRFACKLQGWEREASVSKYVRGTTLKWVMTHDLLVMSLVSDVAISKMPICNQPLSH